MGHKVKKSQKKFVQKHLKGEIQRRKKFQAAKKRREQHTSRDEAGDAAAQEQQQAGEKKIEDMDIDEFLSGGFLSGELGGEGGVATDSEDGGEEGEEDAGLSDLEGSDSEQEEEQEAGEDGSEEDDIEGALESSDEEEDTGSGGSDDEEETGRAAAAGASASRAVREVRQRNSQLRSEVARHKEELERLRERDPEFYKYLQATDKELLDFGAGESEDEEGGSQEEGASDEEDEEDGEEEEEEGRQEDRQKATGGKKGVKGEPEEAEEEGEPGGKGRSMTVTLSVVDSWCKAAKEKASMGPVRSIIKAYRIACHYGDSEEQVDATMRIASSAVYNRLMLFVLVSPGVWGGVEKEADGIFRRMLDIHDKPAVPAAQLTKLPRWRKVEPFIKSYLGNTLHLLGQMTDAAMLAFILRRVRASTLFLAPYEKLQRKFLKLALQLFGSAESGPRVQALLFIRQMAFTLPQPALDNCLKGVYRAFSANAKFVNAASVPHINFMAACVVEMYGVDAAASYQHAFGFIRQLAVLLRGALTAKTKDAYREVYSWQTINCLELWAKVLAAHSPDQPDLRALVYPVAQLLLGAARLVPTPGYFPLRLRCARALNRLGQATGSFIPVAPLLLEVLQWGDLSRPPKPAPGQQPDLLLQLRAGKTVLRSAPFQEEVIGQVVELLADHLSQWSCHVAFPELAHLTLVQLRRFCKATPVDKFRRPVRQLVDVIERNVAFVGRARDSVEFSPKDASQVAAFLAKEREAKQAPLQQYAALLLEKARQRLAMRTAQEVDLGTNGKAGAGSDDDEDAEVAEPQGSMLPSRKHKAARKAAPTGSDSDEQEEGEEEEEVGRKPSKRQKLAAGGGAKGASSDEEDELAADGGDMVGTYQLSDDDLDESSDDERVGVAPVNGAVASSSDEEEGSSGEEEEGYGDEDEDMGGSSDSDDEVRQPKQQQQQQQQQSHWGRGGGRFGEGEVVAEGWEIAAVVVAGEGEMVAGALSEGGIAIAAGVVVGEGVTAAQGEAVGEAGVQAQGVGAAGGHRTVGMAAVAVGVVVVGLVAEGGVAGSSGVPAGPDARTVNLLKYLRFASH
ncbi:hypothetical protein N2152v2_004084 [Parachlorella kessleri]